MTISRPLILLLSAFVLTIAHAADSADELFARATRLAETDLAQSRELDRAAALHYLAEAAAQPEQRGPLLYNAGNAFFLAGDAGRAVLAYRRAEAELPGSPKLRSNLAYVRKQSGNPDEPPPAGWWGVARFWFWRPPVHWLVLAGSMLVFWAALFRRQWTGRSWPRGVIYGALSLAVVMAGMLVGRHLSEAGRCRGVLVTTPVVARKGPSFGYAPAFTAPLGSGLECEVVRRDGDWLYLRLAEDLTAWVPLDSVEIWQGRLPRG